MERRNTKMLRQDMLRQTEGYQEREGNISMNRELKFTKEK
jgi:hypothetical protein